MIFFAAISSEIITVVKIMFRTVCNDFVKTVCASNSALAGLRLAETVLAAGSVHEASKVQVGTFALRKKPSYFWQKEA